MTRRSPLAEPRIGRDWADDAACHDTPKRVMFHDPIAAKAVCEPCPVRQQCLGYALHLFVVTGEHPEGVWGGFTKGERAAGHPIRRGRPRGSRNRPSLA